MTDPIQQAKLFVEQQQDFRLGALLTESFHPKTKFLSQTAATNLRTAVSMLQTVDAEIPPAAKKVLNQPVFADLIESIVVALLSGKRIFFTGCGATGRLAILFEAAWRRFWHELSAKHPEFHGKLPDLSDSVFSIMAGGDFALIKSVEGFEDFPDFGRGQLEQAGVAAGDVVIAITEGGETPFVIGTAWQGLDAGAEVFFVYNNPTQLLRDNVERSREIIEEPRIRKLDLTTGPMAIAGSTRMQATTSELLVIGIALESALVRILQRHVDDAKLLHLGIRALSLDEYHFHFAMLLSRLSTPAAVAAMLRLIEFEESIYRRKSLVTYAADEFLLDVLTDTTERSPTFMVPPFRKCDDIISPQPWAFARNFRCRTPQAWLNMLQRPPRGLDWTGEMYERLNAPEAIRSAPPKLDNSEIYKFRIGNEPDESRSDSPGSVLIAIAVDESEDPRNDMTISRHADEFSDSAAIVIGRPRAVQHTGSLFGFPCQLPPSPLKLWHHLAVKLILNTVSTATMVRMDRVIGNAMVWLSPSNKKLVDRGTRLICQLTGSTYEGACIALHQAIDESNRLARLGKEPPSPVALAISKFSGNSENPR